MGNINVHPDALQELKNAVLEKHGRLWGVMLEEASVAIREHARRLRGG